MINETRRWPVSDLLVCNNDQAEISFLVWRWSFFSPSPLVLYLQEAHFWLQKGSNGFLAPPGTVFKPMEMQKIAALLRALARLFVLPCCRLRAKIHSLRRSKCIRFGVSC